MSFNVTAHFTHRQADMSLNVPAHSTDRQTGASVCLHNLQTDTSFNVHFEEACVL